MTKYITPADMLIIIREAPITDALELLDKCTQVHDRFLRSWSLLGDTQHWTSLTRHQGRKAANDKRDAFSIMAESNLLAMELLVKEVPEVQSQLQEAQTRLALNIELLAQAPAELLAGDHALVKAKMRHIAIGSIHASLGIVYGRMHAALYPEPGRYFDRTAAKAKLLAAYKSDAKSGVWALLDVPSLSVITHRPFNAHGDVVPEWTLDQWRCAFLQVTEHTAKGAEAAKEAESALTGIAVSIGQLPGKLRACRAREMDQYYEPTRAAHAVVVLEGSQSLMNTIEIAAEAGSGEVDRLQQMCDRSKLENGDFAQETGWLRYTILNNLLTARLALRDHRAMLATVEALQKKYNSADWVDKVYGGEIPQHLITDFRPV